LFVIYDIINYLYFLKHVVIKYPDSSSLNMQNYASINQLVHFCNYVGPDLSTNILWCITIAPKVSKYGNYQTNMQSNAQTHMHACAHMLAHTHTYTHTIITILW